MKFKAKKLIFSHLLFGFHEAPILLFGGLGGLSILSGFLSGLFLSFLYFIKGEVIGDRVLSARESFDAFLLWPVRKKMQHCLVEEFGDAASEEEAS